MSFATTGGMTGKKIVPLFDLLASTSKPRGSSVSSDIIDTRGANLIWFAVPVSAFGGSIWATAWDSEGNSWPGLVSREGGSARIGVRYCLNPNTSATHQFFVNNSVYGIQSAGIGVAAFKCNGIIAKDTQAASPNITPNFNPSLVVTTAYNGGSLGASMTDFEGITDYAAGYKTHDDTALNTGNTGYVAVTGAFYLT